MRFLILGASGLLGHTLYRRWSSLPDCETFGTFRSFPLPGLEKLDVLERGAAEEAIARHAPDWVAMPASNPHVDYLEAHEEESRMLNVEATLRAAAAAKRAGARFLFFSSDYIFDGSAAPYAEEAPPSPLNVYGRHKLEVERGLEALSGGFLICRVSGLYGWEFRPRNFVLQVLGRLKRGEPVTAARDQFYAPTYVEELAASVLELCRTGASGVYHLCGNERVSREGFAGKIAETFGFDASLVRGADCAAAARPGGARRPRDSSLDCGKAAGILSRLPAGPSESLARMRARRPEWEAYASALGETHEQA